MNMFAKARELYSGFKEKYNDFTFKMGVNYLNAMDAVERVGEKALPVSLAGLLTLGAGTACKKAQIPYDQQLPAKVLTRKVFFKPNKSLDKITMYIDVGDAVGNDDKNDIVSFDVECWQQYKAVEQLLQMCNKIVLEKGKPKLVHVDPMEPGTSKVDYGVTMKKLKSGKHKGSYQITVDNPDKSLRFTVKGSSEIGGIDKPELKDGLITPKEIVPFVDRLKQYLHYHKSEKIKYGYKKETREPKRRADTIKTAPIDKRVAKKVLQDTGCKVEVNVNVINKIEGKKPEKIHVKRKRYIPQEPEIPEDTGNGVTIREGYQNPCVNGLSELYRIRQQFYTYAPFYVRCRTPFLPRSRIW